MGEEADTGRKARSGRGTETESEATTDPERIVRRVWEFEDEDMKEARDYVRRCLRLARRVGRKDARRRLEGELRRGA